MSYIPRTLYSLLNEMNVSLFLPHIQRPFLWSEEQMRRLFDSLMRDYPIQTFLFWRTHDEIKARRFMARIEWEATLSQYYDTLVSAEGQEKVFVLDGQQRLQTLFSLFKGTIQPPNGGPDLEAYTDLTSGRSADDDGLLYPLKFSPSRLPLPWFRIRDLLGKHSQINALDIADKLNEDLDQLLIETTDERRQRERTVRRNCNQLVSLLREQRHFWIQELDGIANDYPYSRVLDIFVRVNSGGTKLDAADLMFAAMKEGWADIEQHIEYLVEFLNEGKLNFDKNLVLKCIIVALGKGAALNARIFTGTEGENLLETVHVQWDRLQANFEQLRDFIFRDLQLYSDKVIWSYNSFVPLFDYLYHNPKPDEANRRLMKGYYYKSQLFSWYRSNTEGVVDALHLMVGHSLSDGFPLTKITAHFAPYKDIELREDHLQDMRVRFILLNLVYVAEFGSSPFNVSFKGNEPHVDHIYPQSLLKKQLGLPTSEINTLGNYRFVGASDNLRKNAESPNAYFGRLKAGGIDIRRHLLIEPFGSNPALLVMDTRTYRQFRDQRCSAIFKIAERIVNPELFIEPLSRLRR